MLATLFYHAFSSFSWTDLCFLTPAVVAHIAISTAELAIPTGTPINEANAENETQPLTKTKTKKCLK